MKFQVLPKAELMKRMKRFMADKNRGISLVLFAEMVGTNEFNLRKIFRYGTENLSEVMQVRISKGLWEIEQGRVKIMERDDRTRYAAYRREDKPRMTRTTGLTLTNEGIKLKLGIANRNDYSAPTLQEQLDKKHGR